jgi:hypothetical protein
VLELLDGTDVAPVKQLEVEDTDKNKQKVANPAYAAWVARDSMVLSWILNSLSPEILAHTKGVDSTAAVWQSSPTCVVLVPAPESISFAGLFKAPRN